MPEDRLRPAPRQEHVRARFAVQYLQPRHRGGARADPLRVRQERRSHRPGQPAVVRRRLRLGRGQARDQVPDPGHAADRAQHRRQRQHGARTGRHGLGHGDLRDVSHHAGDLRLALPERCLRESGRRRAPGRGRDRGRRVCRRCLLRRQVCGDRDLGPGLLAEAGGAGPRRHGRDPARRHRRATRRALDGPADQVGTGGPLDGMLRQSRRRAQGRHGRERHRGLLLLGHHGAAHRGDLQHGGRVAVRRESRHGAAALPAARTLRGVARAADRPEPGPGGLPALRLGPAHGRAPARHPRPGKRHAYPDGARPRSPELRGL